MMKSLKFRLQYALYLLCIHLGMLVSAFGQITPSQDSYTNSAKATTNFGIASTLGVSSAAGSIQTTYIKFDLSSIPAGYTSANVAKATLKLYVNSVTTAGSFNVDYVTGSWAEKTITANLVPALGGSIASSVPLTTASANNYVEIDVTSAVGEWLNGPQANDGIALVADSGLSATFDSKENSTQSHAAELDIVFASGLPNSCSANQILQWNGSAWVCATEDPGTITGVTAGTALTGGGTSGTVTLNVDTTKVPLLAVSNTFAGSQTINTAGNNGIYSQTNFDSGSGVVGVNNSTAVSATGVWGTAAGYGVRGYGAIGVQGTSTASASGNAGGIFTGYSAQPNSGQVGTPGVRATGGNGDPNTQAHNSADGLDAFGGSGYIGAYGITAYGGNGSVWPGGPGIWGQGGNGPVGGDGIAGLGAKGTNFDGAGGNFTGGNSSQGGDGIDAFAGSGYAGVFHGDVNVTGTLSAAVKNFKIDHPLDPANKYLVHASVESSELMNIYTGNVITDAQGEATVSMPEWFEGLNTDFRYQLTVVGQFAQAIVSHEIESHQFQIKTSAPNVKVSWQVTGVRQDAFAKAHPLVVEQAKEDRLKGFYIHPELYGASDEKQIESARHPQMMKQMKERQAKAAPTTKP
jgi:hypothetical protein